MTGQIPKLRAIFEFLVVCICTGAFAILAAAIFTALLGRDAAGSRDFVEYWAAGQQLIHHANPYDFQQILKLERSAGYPASMPAQMMPNPPYALLLVLPLGLLGSKAAELLWVLLLIVSLIVSARMVLEMCGYPRSLLQWLAYSFAPALTCLLAGQVSLFILLGLVLFLRFHLSRPMLAGASLWLCLLKPHLFLPFGVALILWIVVTRSYKILAGAAVPLGVSTAVSMMIDPQVWAQYRQMMSVFRVDRVPLPCPSAMLREYVYPHTFWLQCIPAVLGCAWAIAYYLERRHNWDWVRGSSILMLVSVLVAPYSWFVDQAVLIPALLYGAFIARSRTLVAFLALLSAALEIGELRGLKLDSAFYFWTSPAWLVWYLFAVLPNRGTEVAVDAS